MFYLLFPFTLLLPSPSGERWKGRAVAPHWFCVVVRPHRADVSRRKDIVGGARPRSFCDIKCRGSRLFPKRYRTSHSCHNICSGRPGSSGACVHPEYSNHLLLVNTSFACRAGSPQSGTSCIAWVFMSRGEPPFMAWFHSEGLCGPARGALATAVCRQC